MIAIIVCFVHGCIKLERGDEATDWAPALWGAAGVVVVLGALAPLAAYLLPWVWLVWALPVRPPSRKPLRRHSLVRPPSRKPLRRHSLVRHPLRKPLRLPLLTPPPRTLSLPRPAATRSRVNHGRDCSEGRQGAA